METRQDGRAPDGRSQRARRRLPRFLTAEEAERLLAQANPRSATGLRNLVALLLMLRAGLRVSEVVNLAMVDLDRKERRLHVRRGKGAKDRTLYLDQQTAVALTLWTERRPHGSRWLLPIVQTGRRGSGKAQAGKQMSVRYLQTLVARLGREAAIEKTVSPHVLRHTFATLELTRGVPVHQLQADLGHADLATTSIYLHVIDQERQRSALERPAMKLPGRLARDEDPAPGNGRDDAAMAVLEALGWHKRQDGSWAPPATVT